MNSYPGRHPALQWLSQLVVDLNLRKNWRAALRSHPDKIVFLGDMLDNGRMNMMDEECVLRPLPMHRTHHPPQVLCLPPSLPAGLPRQRYDPHILHPRKPRHRPWRTLSLLAIHPSRRTLCRALRRTQQGCTRRRARPRHDRRPPPRRRGPRAHFPRTHVRRMAVPTQRHDVLREEYPT